MSSALPEGAGQFLSVTLALAACAGGVARFSREVSQMISLEMAKRLKEAGVVWEPAQGDKFALLDRELDDRVFVINDMATVIELLQGTPAVTFHGTPEWALDYVLLTEAVWLPDEGQLRQRLHDILALQGEPLYDLFYADGEFICRFEWKGEALVFKGIDATDAYGESLLHLSCAV